jgi:hypothetical protein
VKVLVRASVVLISLFQYSCGTVPYIDSELTPYVDMFTKECGYDVSSVEFIIFGEDRPDKTAVCRQKSGLTRRIKSVLITRKHWDALTEVGKKKTMFHELLHCVRYQHHEHATESWDFMLPYTQSDEVILSNWAWNMAKYCNK